MQSDELVNKQSGGRIIFKKHELKKNASVQLLISF